MSDLRYLILMAGLLFTAAATAQAFAASDVGQGPIPNFSPLIFRGPRSGQFARLQAGLVRSEQFARTSSGASL